MTLETVAIISPGDMGHAVGQMLGLHGMEVVTCLANRSERTKRLAAEGGIKDCPTMAEMLERADLVLSIVPPGLAARVAGEVAESMTVSGFYPPYADCNAVSPETAKTMAKRISNAGADFIDGGILAPLRVRGETRPGFTLAAIGRSCYPNWMEKGSWSACLGQRLAGLLESRCVTPPSLREPMLFKPRSLLWPKRLASRRK